MKIPSILKKKILLLDGATGTELHRMGMPSGVCPEAWCIDHPEAIRAVHSGYRKAGADIIYAATFGANRLKLAEYGLSDVKAINRKLVRLAKEAAEGKALVAGDVGPTGRFVAPFGPLDFEEAVDIFKEQIEGLLAGGADLLVVETMMDIQEARAALIAAREITGLFTIVTMTFEKDGRTLNGTDPVTALVTLQSLGADAVGCNCSTGPEDMMRFIAAMKPHATVPLAAKPNAGIPVVKEGETVFPMDATEFGAFGKELASSGAALIGGCCGTTPNHIRSLKKNLRNKKPVLPAKRSIAALTSPRKTVFLDRGGALKVIGERINPTGKKALREALREEFTEGRFTLVRQMARDQEREGADLLDVNVGVPGIDEVKAMTGAVDVLAVATALPLVIDSPKVETIEAALRRYPGRALLNSISGEEEKLDRLLSAAARYGAMFILLPVAKGEVPRTAARRKEVIREVFKMARARGFTKEDLVVDGLVMTVAADPRAALETLETVEWCYRRFGARTVLGLSNVSFGMPGRMWINAAFLAMAAGKGLTLAIANPGQAELMNIKAASDLLTQKDGDAAAFIARFGDQAANAGKRETPETTTPEEKVYQAILEGNREEIGRSIAAALTAGTSPLGLVEDVMIPAITEVGERFDRREYFLPQLIASAEAMKEGMDYLEPHLKEGRAADDRKTVILATVEGDIHDIGKNIVALMVKNHGYRVIDLGKDVPAGKIIEAAKAHRGAVVGLSALMTTTMVRMKEVMELAAKECHDCRFLLGGAVVTKAYAQSLGAEYARDGVEAVRKLEEIFSKT